MQATAGKKHYAAGIDVVDKLARVLGVEAPDDPKLSAMMS
jgi:hypothetical protein